MTVFSPVEQDQIRSANSIRSEVVLNAVPLVEVASASVASAPTYLMTLLNVSGESGWSDIEVGQTVFIRDVSGEIVVRGVVRRPGSAGILFMDVKSDGDAGYTKREAPVVDETCTVHVYRHHTPWALISRATAETQLKAYDIAWSGETDTPPPAVNIGSHRQGWENANGFADFELSASETVSWDSAPTGYAWIIPAGATIVSGGTDQATLTARIPTGTHRVSCAVTLSNGASATGHRWVFVNRLEAGHMHAPLDWRFDIDGISGDTHTRLGREIKLSLRGDARGAVYPGQLLLLTTRQFYDSALLTETHFAGYVEEIEVSAQNLHDLTTTVRLLGPRRMADTLPSATQLLEEAASPSSWTETRHPLSHPGFAAFYILKWHTSGLLDYHDYSYDSALEALRRRTFGFLATTIGGQLKFIEDISVGEVNARSDGSLTFIRESNHLYPAERDALDTIWTWTDDDILPPLQVQARLRPSVGQTRLAAVGWNGAGDADGNPITYHAIAPGYAQGQGTGKPTMTPVSVAMNAGQTDTEWLVGHRFAAENAPLEGLDLEAAHLADVAEPANPDWHALDIDAGTYLPLDPDVLGLDWASGMRARPTKVTRRWVQEAGGWRWIPNVTLRPETVGARGRFLDPGNYATTDPDPDAPIYEAADNLTEFDLCLVKNGAGIVAIAGDFLDDDGPTAAALPLTGIAGVVQRLAWDFQADTPAVWSLSHNAGDNTLYLYRNADVTEPAAWIEIATVTVSGTFGRANLAMSRTQDLVVVAWSDQENGIFVRRLVDGTWESSTTRVGGGGSDTNASTQSLGLNVYEGSIYVAGRSVDGYRLYVGGTSGAFSEIENQTDAPIMSAYPTIQRTGNLLYLASGGSETVTPGGNVTLETVKATPLSNPIISTDPAAVNTATLYGYHQQLWDATLAGGDDYTLESVTVNLYTDIWYPWTDGDPSSSYVPPGYSGSYFTLDGWTVEVQARLYLKDAAGVTLWSSSLAEWDTLSGGTQSVTYAPSPQAFDRVRVRQAITLSGSFPSGLANVRYAELHFETVNAENFFSGSFGAGPYPYFSMGRSFLTAVTADTSELNQRRIYRVGVNTEDWTDASPSPQALPSHPDGIAAFNKVLRAALDDGGGYELLKSTTGGDNWTTMRTVDYRSIKRLSSSLYIAAGPGLLQWSEDGLNRVRDRIGTFATVLGDSDFDQVLNYAETLEDASV